MKSTSSSDSDESPDPAPSGGFVSSLVNGLVGAAVEGTVAFGSDIPRLRRHNAGETLRTTVNNVVTTVTSLRVQDARDRLARIMLLEYLAEAPTAHIQGLLSGLRQFRRVSTVYKR